MRRHALVASVFLLPACASPTEAGTVLTGAWSGESTGLTAQFVLTDNGGMIGGSGTIILASGSVPVTVVGTRTWRLLSLSLSSTGWPSATFVGVMNSGTIEGTFEASATGPVRVTLKRD